MKLSLSEPIKEEDVSDWINADKHKEITDAMVVSIVNIVNKENESSDEDMSAKKKIDV